MDLDTSAYFADVLEQATRRAIATILGELESYTGVKDRRISDVVKDDLNRAKRLIYKKVTGAEVESTHKD